MQSPGGLTRNEILTQPEAWAAALESVQAQADAVREFYLAGEVIYNQVHCSPRAGLRPTPTKRI